MVYFLIALVVMVALSPLISMMPSRRQRQIADLRQRAALLGISVQLRELPNAAASGDLRPWYGRRRPRGAHKIAVNEVYQRAAEGWRSSTGVAPDELPAWFSQLPAGVSHVCENLHEVGIYWDERGSEADIERIDSALQQLLR